MKLETIKVSTTCPICGRETTLEVGRQDYLNWSSRSTSIQEAFPYLTDSQREALLSSFCEKCWDDIFSEEE